MSGLQLNVTLAARSLDLQLDVATGETVAVLGANGAGKSTVLSLIAGLLWPDSGQITLEGRTLVAIAGTGALPSRTDRGAGASAAEATADATVARDRFGGGTAAPGDGRPAQSARNRWVPPHDRGTVLLAQEALLFPHLTVRDNVAFGPRSRGASRREATATATGWLERVNATSLASRRPHQLSGGQSQRVALARALAAEPQLLLLDEPFSALDAGAIPEMRQLIAGVLADRTVVLVTHDPLDALALADRVVVLDGGTVVESGPTRTVLYNPQAEFTKLLTFGLRDPGS